MTIAEIRRRRQEIVAELAVLAAADVLSETDLARYEAAKGEVADLDARLERMEYVAAQQARLEVRDVVPARPRVDASLQDRAAARIAAQGDTPVIENPGFRNVGELMATWVKRPHDPRILALQEMGVGGSGGFAVPTELDPLLREVMPQEAIFRPRATVISAGDPPDAELTMPTLDQTAGANMYGGAAVSWVGEGGVKPETGIGLKEARWAPKEVAAHIIVTDKLLANWSAASTLIERMLRGAILAAEDAAFMSGNGAGRPEGVLVSPALKTVNRAGAGAVAYADLVAMEAELHDEAESVWVVSRRVIPQLRSMEDTGGHLIWQDNARDGSPATLLGREVVTSYRSPALGVLGDVVLMVPSYYVIKDGVGTTIAASEHVLFTQNKTVVKAFRRVDGHPWLSAPIAEEDGQTYSPFVALDVPA